MCAILAFLFLANTLLAQSISESAELSPFPALSLPIASLFNNNAASSNGSANFDGKGASFNSAFLPTGPWEHDGITYDLPAQWGTQPDNVVANGQIFTLDDPKYVQELHFLYSGDAGNGTHEFVANFLLTFVDNTTQQVQLYARNWWRWPILNTGVIQTPYHFELNGAQTNWNSSQMFQWSTSVLSESPLKTITFPAVNTAHRLHLFGLALSPALAPSNTLKSSSLAIRRTRFTSRWEIVNEIRAQAVEVTLANLLPSSSTVSSKTSLNSRHEIAVVGPGIKTISPGVLYRLGPGDQVQVDVFVTGAQDGSNATVILKGKLSGESSGWKASSLIEHWTPDAEVLSKHETPTWWNRAKFGIFIHWGVYSYPAWAPPSQYAEWYDYYLHNPANSSSPTWQHHLDTYGTNVVYDDFIPNFTASKWNASEWVNLFDDAGAKYFVFVTKHHDGFALFDTGDTTHRSSVYLGPTKRDFVKELLQTSKQEKPNLGRGTYYSLPEWFNPDSAKYGFGQWPGGLAHDAFNSSELEPYTGRLNVTDYINDLQFPNMVSLAIEYDTEIMWCDIGGPNRTLEFAAQFYNHAFSQGRQVTMNNRCGAVPDFDTPEYATLGAIQTRSWESSEGMDPFSYGLNAATNASQYKNGTTIVQTLVDIASKGGNYLLDIGPTAEGDIIQPMQDGLLDTGSWLKYAGECVYDTDYWFQTSQDFNLNPPARFLTTSRTFCIIAFAAPSNGQLVINKRLPILPGDTITLLSSSNGSALPWSVNHTTGQLTVSISAEAVAQGKFAWPFKVQYTFNG
ncbi:glycoside hydrolase family 29 protein [Mycena floridula]|nr:glycoside hydrolase family 29 protein [Mycena floridula]